MGVYLVVSWKVGPTLSKNLENHVTPQELRTLLRRSGDVNLVHSPSPPLTSNIVPVTNYRGRLLLNMIHPLEFIITYIRFPFPSPTLWEGGSILM